MNLASIALDGLRKAEQKLEKSGREMARLPAPPVAEAGDEAVVSGPAASLRASVTGLIEARQMYEANLKLVSAGEEFAKHTIDLIG